MRWFFTILILLFIGPSCGTTQQHRNASISVSREGQIVHESSRYISSRIEFLDVMDKPSKKYIIFMLETCPNCEVLRQAMIKSKHINKVLLLDLKQDWVYDLYKAGQIEGVPTMITTNDNGKFEYKLIGSTNIIMYLITYVDI